MAAKARAKRVKTPSLLDLQTRIRSAGLRSTGPRTAVLSYLHTHGGRNSHADLFGALGDQGFDRATIYRVLMDFAEARIVSRTDLGDHVWRFELRKDADSADHEEEHPHFVCVDCGDVLCLPAITFKVSASPKIPRAVAKRKVSVQLKGRCNNCESEGIP